MKQNFYYPSKDGLTKIHAIEWKPEGAVKAVLQISHGMIEFIDRYDDFARYLNGFGFYVVGNDHLGHGESVVSEEKHGYFANPHGNECVIADLHTLRKMTKKKYPDVPYFMLGHSMGSFLIRQYMELHGNGLDGVIVMGTGSQPAPVLAFGMVVCRLIAALKGWDYRSKLIDNLAFSSYNKRFEPVRTDKDWLTKDEKIVDAYREHPWCGFIFTVNSFYHMFRGIRFVQKKENIERIPKELPLFFVAGSDDPVGNYGKSVQKVYTQYRAAGIRDIRIKLYDKDRHEILNETDRKEVYSDLKNWLEQLVEAR